MTRSARISVAYGLLAVAVLSAVAAIYFLGISFYIITGSSMESAVPRGALAIERRVSASSLRVGDIITFQPPGTTGNVTHRIIAISTGEDGQRIYETKGDANDAVDPWRFSLDRPDQARLLTSVPWLGYFFAFFTLRVIRAVFLAGIGLGVVIIIVIGLRETFLDSEEEWAADEGRIRR